MSELNDDKTVKVETVQPEKEPDTEVTEETGHNTLDVNTASYILQNRWEEIIRTHCGNNLAAASLLMNKKNIAIQGDTIIISIANDVAERNIREALATIKPALYSITGIQYNFEFTIMEVEQPTRIINPEEKFHKLCELNPELKLFKETLGLAIT